VFDPTRLRAEFPILQQEINGRRLVYLDSAASSQRPRAVVDAMRRYYEHDHANVHRGVHLLAERATRAYEESRARVAKFIGAPDPATVIWTRNATEALNLVAHTWGRSQLREGDEILLTVMEHHSNLVPWQMLAAERGIVLRHIPLTPDYRLDKKRLDDLLTARTRLVCVSLMSNVLGTINPVAEIAAAAHAAGAKIVVDAAQAAPHIPIDVAALGCDFLAFSGHKMLGPTGIGVLYGKRELLEAMPPFLGGGEMISQVRLDGFTPNVIPHKFEAGTPSIAEAVGLAAAMDYLDALGMDAVAAHEREITAHTLRRLREIPGLRILGPETERGSAVSFVMDGVHPHDVATVLDREGVAVRAGHHCTMPLHDVLGVPASTRASFYIYNDHEDVDRLLEALERARKIFGVTA